MSSVINTAQSGEGILAWKSFLLITTISIAVNISVHSDVRSALSDRYPGDSFYTLSTAAAFGLVAISATLIAAVLLLFWWSTTVWIKHSLRRSFGYTIACFVLDLGITVAVYLLMLVMVPQVFYTYYQFVFSGLPLQWVIKPLPWQVLHDLVRLPTGASMAEHLAGFTLWVISTSTVIQWLWCRIYSDRFTDTA